jgi:arylsulfatase A-like enzyme
LLGVDPTGAKFHGRSFANLVHGTESPAAKPPTNVFIEVDFPLQDPRISPVRLLKRAWVGPRYKLIVDDDRDRVELYDVVADPGEQRDLAGEQIELRERMLAELREQIELAHSGGPPAEAIEMSDAELEVLRKLGYVE